MFWAAQSGGVGRQASNQWGLVSRPGGWDKGLSGGGVTHFLIRKCADTPNL